MNKENRKDLQRALEMLEDALTIIDDVLGQKIEKFEKNADVLTEVSYSVNQSIEQLNELI